MTTDVESRLRDLFESQAAEIEPAVPVRFDPERLVVLAVGKQHVRARALVSMAAAVLLIVGLGVVWSTRGEKVDPIPLALPDNPGILGWAELDDVVQVRSNQVYPADGGFDAAVQSPDGTVFGLHIAPRSKEWVPRSETHTVMDREVSVEADSSAPGEIYRTFADECVIVDVTTADEDVWSSDTLQLLSAIEIEGSALRIGLREKWRSLGVAEPAPIRIIEATLGSGSESLDVSLVQVPGVPAARFLATMESSPQLIDVDGSAAWLVESVTTPGLRSIVGTRRGIAFEITAATSADRLVSLVSQLELAAPPAESSEPVITAAPADGAAVSCGSDLSVEIVDPLQDVGGGS